MEAVEQPQKAQGPSADSNELNLLLQWDTDQTRSKRAGTLSVVVHVAVLIILASVPREAFRVIVTERHVTPLVAPPPELTQRAPNRGKISKSFDIESLKPRPRIQVPPSPPSTTRPRAQKLTMPKAVPNRPLDALPEPPQVAIAKDNGPKLPEGMPQAPPPQIQTEEQPKLAFETPGAAPAGKPGGLGKLAPPANTVDEAVRNLSHGGGGGGLIVGDVGIGTGGIGAAINQPPSPGKRGSNLELLSDPMGVDFRPYLLQLLQTVRRNWFAVMPESAKPGGLRGKVAIQFAIAKNGEVTKVVFATNSGIDALDRAAVASVSMSNPFPPLPAEFRGSVVKLQFTFLYNIPTR